MTGPGRTSNHPFPTRSSRPGSAVRNRMGGGHSVAVLSGKGGVGKTSVSVNLALSLRETGARVLLVDGAHSLGSVDLFLGLEPHRNSSHYFDGVCPLAETLALGPRGLAVLPSAAGRGDLVDPGPVLRQRFLRDLAALRRGFDWTVLDLPAGIGDSALDLAREAEAHLLLATPEPASILHAYAAAKSLSADDRGVRLVINRIRSAAEHDDVASRLARTVSRHLGHVPEIWGSLPEDPAVLRAACAQEPFVLLEPRAPVSLRVRVLARRLVSEVSPAGGPFPQPRKAPVLPLQAA